MLVLYIGDVWSNIGPSDPSEICWMIDMNWSDCSLHWPLEPVSSMVVRSVGREGTRYMGTNTVMRTDQQP